MHVANFCKQFIFVKSQDFILIGEIKTDIIINHLLPSSTGLKFSDHNINVAKISTPILYIYAILSEGLNFYFSLQCFIDVEFGNKYLIISLLI